MSKIKPNRPSVGTLQNLKETAFLDRGGDKLSPQKQAELRREIAKEFADKFKDCQS